MNSEDIINGVFRPIVGFFIGMALAYTFQLAQGAGWIFAIGWLLFLAVLFGAIVLFDGLLGRISDKIFGGPGIKPARKRADQPKPHWFLRFGWMIGLTVGFTAVFVLPEEALAWL